MKNNKGNSILSFIVVIGVTAFLLSSIIPMLSKALANRAMINKEYVKSIDTNINE